MKQQINEIKRMQQLAGVISEISGGGIVVYASSTPEGMFEELVVLNKSDIISDNEEDEDGAMICVYKHDNKEDKFYYIDKVEI